jgi:hypothetical protein
MAVLLCVAGVGYQVGGFQVFDLHGFNISGYRDICKYRFLTCVEKVIVSVNPRGSGNSRRVSYHPSSFLFETSNR